jgi:Fe-S-cluster containining protein
MSIRKKLSKNKVGRFINIFFGKQPNRKGECRPTECETLDGQKGAACCKLGYKCPALDGVGCSAYNTRPPNCRVFPNNEDDLKLVKNCSYWFE